MRLHSTGSAATACVAALLVTGSTAGTSATRPAPPVLARVAIIGASVTDGFLLPRETGAMITIADVFRAAIREPIDPFRRSSAWFFRDPRLHGECFVDAAVAHDPTLVVAIDFMFWFGYGLDLVEPQRVDLFEFGISLLDRFQCPIVVGDYPDMSQATRGIGIVGGPMIGPFHLPRADTRDELNRRLREWAAKKGNVIVLPLGEFTERVKRNENLEILGNRWTGEVMKALIDRDLLHTNLEGDVALTLFVADSLLKVNLGLERDDFVIDKDDVRQRVLAARAAEIAQRRRR